MRDKPNGFQFQYGIEKTEEKGLGIVAKETIPKGSIVWRHVPGVYEVYDEAAFRAKIEKMPDAGVVYELTHVHAFEEFPGCIIRALDDGILINHSQRPTLATNKVEIAALGLDPTAPDYLQSVADALLDDRYSLIATRDIDAGEELANDYAQDDECPPFFDALYEQYEVKDDYLDLS